MRSEVIGKYGPNLPKRVNYPALIREIQSKSDKMRKELLQKLG